MRRPADIRAILIMAEASGRSRTPAESQGSSTKDVRFPTSPSRRRRPVVRGGRWTLEGQVHARRVGRPVTACGIWAADGQMLSRPVLCLHATAYCYEGDADPQAPDGMAAIYRDLTADDNRTRQITADVAVALDRGRHCLVLTQWVAHLHTLAAALQAIGHDPVVLRGGMTARARAAALARLQPQPGGPPLLVVATGPYVGEGFDCPALDTLFLAAPIRWKGRLVQYAGRILRPYPGKDTAEVHDYHDAATGVLAATLAGHAPGYTVLGFPDPRRTPPTPTAASGTPSGRVSNEPTAPV
jgi:hypothetical protein